MKIDVLLGLQWGDEGKGKIVDYLTFKYDIIARFQGGPNAGHTLQIKGDKHVLHTIPSGIFHPDKINLIGNGVIIDPKILVQEIDKLIAKGVNPKLNLLISKRAHLILPTHRMLDAAYEQALGTLKIGSTLKGIGPCYTDKTARYGIRVGDMLSSNFIEKYELLKLRHLKTMQTYDFDINTQLIDKISFNAYEENWFAAVEILKSYQLVDSELYINKALAEGKSILAEGAQGSMLDVDFGSYPFVTSSNTITAGVCSGLGVPPTAIGKVYGVFKAYCTRVGSGPFPTELFDTSGEKMRVNGNEFGSTTGRARRCGWLDIPALKYAIMLNGVTDLVMMKSDVLNDFKEIKVCTGYKVQDQIEKELTYETLSNEVTPVYDTFTGWMQPLTSIKSIQEAPEMLSQYIEYIKQRVGLPIEILSTGPGREETII